MRVDPKHLTVGLLRQLIADLPDDRLVYTEGCDCVGPASGVETLEHWSSNRPYLVINRNDSIKDDDE